MVFDFVTYCGCVVWLMVNFNLSSVAARALTSWARGVNFIGGNSVFVVFS